MGHRNRITAIGLELEGGWNPVHPGIKRDGSVVGIPDGYASGEVTSDPLASLDAAVEWMKDNYPQTVNSSCGFHVHVSLPNIHYSRLMDENFNQKFLSAMEDFWHKYRGQPSFDLFRSRLDGQNQYCQKVFKPEEQLWRTEAYGDRHLLPRYRQLNFCFGRHGTLECRLFPCFENVEHSIEGMKAFIESINGFLSTCKPRRPIVMAITKDSLAMSDTVIGRPSTA